MVYDDASQALENKFRTKALLGHSYIAFSAATKLQWLFQFLYNLSEKKWRPTNKKKTKQKNCLSGGPLKDDDTEDIN